MYTVRHTLIPPELKGLWDGPAWSCVESLTLTHARPEGSDHRPKTHVKLQYDDSGVYGIFRVFDRFVRSIHTEFMDPVCNDSCVEFFVKPKPGGGYFNFEFNCGGTLLSSYIRDSRRTAGGFGDYTPLSVADGKRVAVYHSLPGFVDPELTVPTEWLIEFFIPFALIAKYSGPLGDIKGTAWAANFYKCGDSTSHPHWLSWMPLREKNFHLPDCFGILRFDDRQPQSVHWFS